MNVTAHALRGLLAGTTLIATISATAQMSITPAPGEVSELSEFYLNFDGEWGLGSQRSARITITGPEGVVLPAVKNKSTGENYRIYFEDDAVITTPGEYTLTIPAHKFEINAAGDENEETSYTYTIVETAPQLLSIDPAPGIVASLSEFAITFNGEWSLGSNRGKAITITGPEDVEIPKIKGRSMGEYYAIYLEDDAELLVGGEYTLTIPEGKFAVDDVDVPEMTFVYTIDQTLQGAHGTPYAITPEPGVYESLTDGFTIVFDTEEEFSVNDRLVSLDGPDGPIDIYVAAPRNMPIVTIAPIDADGEVMALTQPGTYKLILGYGGVSIGGMYNDEPYVFEYTVTGDTRWAGDYTADPADESSVESLHNITIKFVGARKVVLSETATAADMPTLYDIATDKAVCQGTAFAEGNTMDITLTKEVTTPGTYVLIVPAALFTVDGAEAAEEIFLTYSVSNAGSAIDYTVTVTPDDGSVISNDDVITVTFGGEGITSVSHDQYAWGNALPHFTNEMGAYNPGLLITNDGLTYTLTHTWEFETPGTYTLVIPAGYFTITNASSETVKSKEITLSYHVALSSVESIMAEGNRTDVYSVSGVKVLDGATASQVKTLPAGIYVINGKKAHVK